MQFSNVNLAYGERTILRQVNLTIEKGEFVFLIGSSWSWKTSFIRGLIGAFRPKEGFIYNSDMRDVYALPSKDLLTYRRSIGVIFQDFKLLPRKTVRENVAFAMEVCWYDNSTIAHRVPEVLAQVWLLTKKEKFIESLSGWELQRTAIARALIHDPEIIIWDEPTGNLDPRNAEEIIWLLLRLHQAGKTIVIATHDDRLVNAMKKRVITFADWHVVSDVQEWTYNL